MKCISSDEQGLNCLTYNYLVLYVAVQLRIVSRLQTQFHTEHIQVRPIYILKKVQNENRQVIPFNFCKILKNHSGLPDQSNVELHESKKIRINFCLKIFVVIINITLYTKQTLHK